MSRYEERLTKDLAHISEKLAALAEAVEAALKDASHALLSSNDKLAYTVVLGDLPINRASRALDRVCHSFIAVHLPSAGHLRFVSSVMRVNLELERIGDYAVNICRESVQLGHLPEGTVAPQMEHMANESQRILSQAIKAFNKGNADQAKDTIEMAAQVARAFDTVFKSLIDEGEKLRVQDLFAYLVIFNMLSRVIDQAKNICEETMFAATGETKAAKVYRVLFLDEDNSTLGPMAQAIARKSFPHSGEFTSAGRQAADAINGNLLHFLEEHNIEPADGSPKALDPAAAEQAGYHVIVSLQGSVKSYIDPVPFHTAALEWEVGEPDSDPTSMQLEALYRTLALQVRDLMTTLRGEDAT